MLLRQLKCSNKGACKNVSPIHISTSPSISTKIRPCIELVVNLWHYDHIMKRHWPDGIGGKWEHRTANQVRAQHLYPRHERCCHSKYIWPKYIWKASNLSYPILSIFSAYTRSEVTCDIFALKLFFRFHFVSFSQPPVADNKCINILPQQFYLLSHLWNSPSTANKFLKFVVWFFDRWQGLTRVCFLWLYGVWFLE